MTPRANDEKPFRNSVVPAPGLEPGWPKPRDFKSSGDETGKGLSPRRYAGTRRERMGKECFAIILRKPYFFSCGIDTETVYLSH